ncbi:hypothetical protein LXA43DRAFT_1096614 [Ganoderma leucocontextum]|nr:hypothetical protein LXA43DRAFT_1096614 [Ganoderma leucocontextum]
MLCDTSWVIFLSGCLSFVSLGKLVAGANVTWISPLRGDAYGSGDTIVGQWDAEKPVRSPSFRLCMVNGGVGVVKRGNEGSAQSCGAAVRPTVQQSQADGSYVIHMMLPNVTIPSQCYLEMKDDSGKTSSSPAFSYLPSVEADAEPADLEGEAMAVPEPPSANPSASSSAQPGPIQSSTSSSPAFGAQPSAPSQSVLSLEDSRVPTPTAAYAVPLSLVSTILVAAGGLAIHQRRKLRAERLREREALEARQSQAIPRPSALDPVGLGLGFVTLGRGPAPAARSVASLRELGDGHASIRSASGSMSRTRAWRRDVSRHEAQSHPHPPPPDADEETYVARSDDGRSIVSSRASRAYLPKSGEPRRPSRAPFYASTGASRRQPRHTTVPASMFRESPIGLPYPRDGAGGDGEHLHYHHHDHASRENKYATYGRRRYIEEEEEEYGRLKRRDSLRGAHRAHGPASEDYQDATANDGVMARDIDLSPIPLSPAQPLREPGLVSRPERLHDGRYAQGAFDFDKAPRPGGADRNIYDVVARKVSRGDLV